jgi:hypothetical protein
VRTRTPASSTKPELGDSIPSTAHTRTTPAACAIELGHRGGLLVGDGGAQHSGAASSRRRERRRARLSDPEHEDGNKLHR